VPRFCGLFCTQHVFTAAQGTYTKNILDRLDPDATIFETVSLICICTYTHLHTYTYTHTHTHISTPPLPLPSRLSVSLCI